MSLLPQEFLQQLYQQEPRAVARSISYVENESPEARELLKAVYKKTGRAYRVGVTGPPGAGKSTLTAKLAEYYRKQGLTIAIIAVDPTSPFTGGALLGDRIRMQSIAMDEGIYVRSMATRGSLGGLSKRAKEAADVLDAAGYDIVIFETVGVGQSELDIAKAADTTIVMLVPESGDAIQAMKSGLMEIADFFVMNKSDRAGADQAVMALKTILTFRITHKEDEWIPDVVKTIAAKGEGVEEVARMIGVHKAHLEKIGELERRRLHRTELFTRELVDELLRIDFWNDERGTILAHELERMKTRKSTPHEVAEQLVKNFRENGSK